MAQIMQVRGGGRVELQRAGQCVEDLIGRMLVASLLQAQVVVGADARASMASSRGAGGNLTASPGISPMSSGRTRSRRARR